MQDEGSPPLSASLNVSIRMDPVPPTFGQPVYEADLFEFTDEVMMHFLTCRNNAILVLLIDTDWSGYCKCISYCHEWKTSHVLCSLM